MTIFPRITKIVIITTISAKSLRLVAMAIIGRLGTWSSSMAKISQAASELQKIKTARRSPFTFRKWKWANELSEMATAAMEMLMA